MAKEHGLGKGLGAIFGTSTTVKSDRPKTEHRYKTVAEKAADGLCELVQLLLIEVLSRLIRIRLDATELHEQHPVLLRIMHGFGAVNLLRISRDRIPTL